MPARSGINVLVVSFDALRPDALGTYGYPKPTSPNIDAFAEESILFERAYAASPITPTSFAAAFSGKLPHRVFRRWRFEARPTIAQLFTDADYQTAALMNNVNLADERNFDRGFREYTWFKQRIPDDRLLDLATDWLERHARERFFLWVHFNSPHAPYDYREMARHLYDPSYQGRFARTSGGRFEVEEPQEVRRIRSLYDGEVFFADSLFGALMDALENLGLEQDTLVVLTADHGEEFLEHGGLQHKHLWEPVVRIPLVVRHPDAPESRRVATPVSHVDLLPTLVDVASLPRPPDLDGLSLQRAPPSDRVVMSQAITSPDYIATIAVRGTEKLVLNCVPARSLEFYRLSDDPEERLDLARSDPEPARVILGKLRRALGPRPCEALTGATRDTDPTVGLDREAIDELRALGYVD